MLHVFEFLCSEDQICPALVSMSYKSKNVSHVDYADVLNIEIAAL